MKEQNQKTMAKVTFGTIVLATVLIILLLQIQSLLFA